MNHDLFGVASFRSRQNVIKLDRALKRNNISSNLITTPKKVSMGCGLSVQFDLKDFDRVREVMGRERPETFMGFYTVDKTQGYMRVLPLK
jgi:hypothetical protein